MRELENCIERAVLTATDGCIRSYNLPPSMQGDGNLDGLFMDDEAKTLEERLKAAERHILSDAISRHGGSHSAAGRELGVSPRMMSYRLAKVGLR